MADQTLLFRAAGSWAAARIRENRVPVLSCAVMGMLCYTYAFTNKLVNHDEVQSLFLKGATVSSGRWGLGFLDTVFPNYSMPWIYGVISLVLIAAAACLMIRILDIREPTVQALLAGSIVAFPSLMGTFAYMFTASSFALSFLMAVLAVRLLRREKLLFAAASLGCMVFSLSIYQSYISVAAGLLVVCLIRDLLQGEEVSLLLRRGVGYVVYLAAALGVYYLATQVIFLLKDVTFNDYASDNIGFSLSRIPAAIGEAYTSFLRFFTEGYRGLVFGKLSRAMHLLSLAACAGMLALWCADARSAGRYLLLAFLIAVLPLAINCMYLFTAADAVHTLVLYGFINLYALFAVVTEQTLSAGFSCRVRSVFQLLGTNAVTLAMAVILLCNTYLANRIWLNLQLRYENTYAFYTGLMSQIRALPEFGPDATLALIGDYPEPEFYSEHFADLDQITGVKGISPDSYSKERFLEYYVGVSLPFASEETAEQLASDPLVAQMPPYPCYGSIAAFGDTIVVKLS